MRTRHALDRARPSLAKDAAGIHAGAVRLGGTRRILDFLRPGRWSSAAPLRISARPHRATIDVARQLLFRRDAGGLRGCRVEDCQYAGADADPLGKRKCTSDARRPLSTRALRLS